MPPPQAYPSIQIQIAPLSFKAHMGGMGNNMVDLTGPFKGKEEVMTMELVC